jgi:tRNA dimethylallyltransferase
MANSATSRGVILLMGPTGSGKSALAIRLAEQLPLELISVDSAMVYRGMDIGTAKPERALRERVAHHLIDIRDPAERYSAGDFVLDARRAAEQIWARGKTPLLVGGTMLYFHALTAGIADLPEGDAAVRERIDADAARFGWPTLHAELAKVDPLAASRIHVNDPQRIQRALEVFRLTGSTISSLQHARLSVFSDAEIVEFAMAPLERPELHTRISRRFSAMIEAGFVDEVRGFYARGDLTAEHPAMRAVGYRQLWRHLAGQIGLDEATAQALAATRQLAKRQFTWLRRRVDARWWDSMHPEVASLMFNALSKCGFVGV